MNVPEMLESLRSAIERGQSIGLEDATDRAAQILQQAEQREGFTGETYVLALIGGTGVGKSTLLNALAGASVSEASVIRPTTQRPRAWVATSAIDEVRPLLDWLEVDEVVTHESPGLDGVAIVDMPDIDSIVAEHRMTVDWLLPRLDSLLWMVDPEKYDDERLYVYLRRVRPRADSFHIILNKADRLSAGEQAEISRDLMRHLVQAGIDGAAIHIVSAASGYGISELVENLEARAEAKRIVLEKIRGDVRAQIESISAAAGIPPGSEPQSLLTEESLSGYRDEAIEAAIDIVDPAGIGSQVGAAYLEKAQSSAGSLLGRLASLIRLVVGSRRRNADPVRYMRDWRSRGEVSRTVNTLRQAYLDATSGLPPAARAAILGRLDPGTAKDAITTALDSAMTESAVQLQIRTPLLWRFLTVLQIIATGGVMVALAWYLTLWLAPGDLPVGTIEAPVAGPIPVPLALLVGSGVLSLTVGALVRLHATWIGRRHARHLVPVVRSHVASSIDRFGFDTLTRLEADRAELTRLRAVSRAE